jgi:hypothetical protein
MKSAEWKVLLSKWTRSMSERSLVIPGRHRPDDNLQGLGFPGASETQLGVAEKRLGMTLPHSYRQFLAATNGLLQPSDFVPASGGDFLPAEGIDWFRVRNLEWIETYENPSAGLSSVPDSQYFVYGEEQDSCHFRVEYLRTALEISTRGDSAVYLLNPRVIGVDGEWEAWLFANWLPGATRFRSFREMMESHYGEFQKDFIEGF